MSKRSELHVTAHRSPRSGEPLIGADRSEMSQVSPRSWMVQQ
jgi:hypothetical protein